ncbi:MAG: hypothetical protein LBT22_06620 [Peptococcaceae bacterium]|jgi:hypothetical protein|nr:hypothetical protein [Peptococcaceae bacterium]
MKSKTKASLFLVELLMDLLLFAFCAAICTQIFVAASRQTKASENLNRAVREATSVAELYKVGSDQFPDEIDFYFDEDWQVASEQEWNYVLTVSVDREKDVAAIIVAELRETTDESYLLEKIYSLTASALSNDLARSIKQGGD